MSDYLDATFIFWHLEWVFRVWVSSVLVLRRPQCPGAGWLILWEKRLSWEMPKGSGNWVVISPFSHSGFSCLSGNLGSDSAGTEMESSLKTQRVNDWGSQFENLLQIKPLLDIRKLQLNQDPTAFLTICKKIIHLKPKKKLETISMTKNGHSNNGSLVSKYYRAIKII